jgi:hypothetical protein
MPVASSQFGRHASVILAKGGQGLDLSQLRFTFRTTNNDADAPNTCRVRIYNLSDKTLSNSLSQYDRLIVDVGYENNHAQIFDGTIRQFRYGNESNVDSFLEVMAADNDIGYNFGIINKTFAPGTTPEQELTAYANTFNAIVDPAAITYVNATGGVMINPRGKVSFGLTRSFMRDFANTFNARWSIQGGVLYLIPLTGYLQGDIIKINSLTGMIGVPEATETGIMVKTLLNPLIKIGNGIQINNRDITKSEIRDQFFPGYLDKTFIANTSRDGMYRVLVAEHSGDTRGSEWFTSMTCLNLDQSAPPLKAVEPFG